MLLRVVNPRPQNVLVHKIIIARAKQCRKCNERHYGYKSGSKKSAAAARLVLMVASFCSDMTASALERRLQFV